MPEFSQATRLLRLTTPLGADALLAECVRGEETISEGFTFTISALSLDAAISLRALLGQPALLELLTVKSGQRRPFHGYFTAVELNGTNGGMARYTLTLQPWLAFLGRSRDSRIFQDKTVFEILDAVFTPYQGMGKLNPAWRFDVADQSVYPSRSLTTQYQESDLAFAERLMSEEGLYYFFTHTADGHEMVIADHNGAFQPNQQGAVRFTQPGAVMKEDSIDRWRSELRLQTNSVELQSWDYRTLDSRHVASPGIDVDSTPLISRDVPGAYAYADRTQGQRIADNQMQALDVRREVFTGAGTVRTLAPGTTFSLSDHAVENGQFAITRVVHLMHNNLSADLQGDLHRRVGEAPLSAVIMAEVESGVHALGRKMGERPLYRNRIDAVRASLPYRASRVDGHGQLLHPRPTIQGQQSAVVVGPAGSVIHTDRDHRVKVQFHWQRGTDSHSRLAHHAPDSHIGAPADDTAGTWVRIAAPLAPVAGANWGSNAVPRIGQEVLIDFIEGNIDRPVIIGALYNGAGKADAQHNQVAQGAGAATGNAPVWFPGEAGAHAHPAVLSGLKSQTMQASQAGAGAYSQLVFDDTPGQPRVGLQRHASPHKGTAELNLGHLRHQTDNERLQPVGFGAELKTEHSVAVRAGQGLLLSTDARPGGNGHQLESTEAHMQITASHQLQEALTNAAQKHKAKLKDEPAAAKLPAIEQVAYSAKVIAATDTGSTALDAAVADGGTGKATAYSEPHIQLSSPYGIAATTPAHALLSAAKTSSITTGQDINFAAQANSLHAVAKGISLFTYGKAINKEKPIKDIGIRLHSASGKVSTQSQADETKLTADKSITVASIDKTITIAGKEHVLLTAKGAYIRIKGGNIEVHGPGVMAFKASMKELTGPQSSTMRMADLPSLSAMSSVNASGSYTARFTFLKNDERSFEGYGYKIMAAGKTLVSGKTSAAGETAAVNTEKMTNVKAYKTIMREDQKITEAWEGKLSSATEGEAPDFEQEDSGLPDEYFALYAGDQ